MVDERRHHFNQGYEAPISREKREEQVKLVNKYFMKEKKSTEDLRAKVINKAENLVLVEQANFNKAISRDQALQRGEERRKEALQRREKHLKEQVKIIIFLLIN